MNDLDTVGDLGCYSKMLLFICNIKLSTRMKVKKLIYLVDSMFIFIQNFIICDVLLEYFLIRILKSED